MDDDDKNQIKEAKPESYNNRLPEGIKDIRIFNKGWKFDMFNIRG
jgi:hypothetical protein